MTKTKGRKVVKIVLIILLVLLVVFSVASFVFVKINFDDVFSRTALDENSIYLRYSDVKDRYDRELLSFKSGENMLQGYLYGADNDKGLVVISHGLGGGAEEYLAETLYFVDNGYKVFGYDNTGCYGSEGENCIGLPQSVTDLDAALSFIEEQPRFEGLPVLLYGHSWGGYAVTAIFNFDHDIAASVSVAGFNKPFDMIIDWAEGMIGNFTYVEYPYIWLYQYTLFGNRLYVTAVDGLNKVDTPVLIIHGSGDNTVGYNGTGIINYRDEITNPNVQFKTCEKEDQNGRSDLFLSLEAIKYTEGLDKAYQELLDQYGDNIPEEVEKEFIAGVDREKSSRLDAKFMEDVLAFYDDALK